MKVAHPSPATVSWLNASAWSENTRVKVRLVRKYARAINGIDLSTHNVGDVMDLTAEQGRLLVAEGWAVNVEEPRSRSIRERLNRAADKRRSRDA